MESLHLVCDAGTARFGAYVYENNAVPSCSTSYFNEAFEPAQHVEFIAGRCANTADGNSVEIDVTGLTLPTCVAGTGDPHLTNLRGQKFDIHDGSHRFVHYPRDAPEDQALLKIDAQAVDIGTEADCYSVFLQNIKLSGKWVGDDITLITNTSVSSKDPSAFGVSFALQQMDWSTLSKQHKGHMELKGSVPVSVDASMQQNSGEGKQLVAGGEEINVKVGDKNPVLVQVWSSYVDNWMTAKKGFRYLNLNVQNLPKDAGGILGLDSYSKPSSSRCGLVQTERDLATYIGDDLNLLRLKASKMPQWTATAREQ